MAIGWIAHSHRFDRKFNALFIDWAGRLLWTIGHCFCENALATYTQAQNEGIIVAETFFERYLRVFAHIHVTARGHTLLCVLTKYIGRKVPRFSLSYRLQTYIVIIHFGSFILMHSIHIPSLALSLSAALVRLCVCVMSTYLNEIISKTLIYSAHGKWKQRPSLKRMLSQI